MKHEGSIPVSVSISVFLIHSCLPLNGQDDSTALSEPDLNRNVLYGTVGFGGPRETLKEITELGRVMALSRNDSVVIERHGVYRNYSEPDGKQIVFRASRPETEEEIREYRDLLSRGLVAPANMEIYVCNADGSGLRQVTNLGNANWAPFFHPSGEKIIFSSNHHSDGGFDFQLFLVNLDGTGLEQVTTESRFNAFPVFSPDGKKLVFSSNRNNGGTRDTNVFIAGWEE